MEALIQVMESTIATRDPYTVGHQQRVTRMACSIAREMGLPEKHIRELRIAGRLHDLGKIAIPTGLLSKSGALTPLEFALIQTHPQVAYDILKPIKFPGNTSEIILQHHERLDGSGYPRGLQGNDILMEARILGVADVVEAMCSHRPYRPSLGLSEALEEITRHQGILYDAEVVKTCLRLYRPELHELDSLTCGPPLPAVAIQGPLPRGFHPWLKSFRGIKAPGISARTFVKENRTLIHVGMISLLGWLLMMSLRGY
jgi:HD-GYP domain-containing protein (c-di-GMP phosphodiesterase class II)